MFTCVLVNIPLEQRKLDRIFSTNGIDCNKDCIVNAFIYCENDNEQGHVYYGTYSVCVRGNGYTTKVMDDPEKNKLIVIERYYVD